MRYNAVVVGLGTGGYPAAVYLASRGLKVAVVEEHLIGGECTNYGCVPSKAFYNIAEAIRSLEKIDGEASVKWESLVEWARGVVKESREGIKGLFESHNVELIEGKAVLKSPREVLVENAGGRKLLEAERILLALGTNPSMLPGVEFDGRGILSNRDVFYLDEKPESMLIIGGGVVGVEIANAFSALKVNVVLVTRRQILSDLDRDVAQALKLHLT